MWRAIYSEAGGRARELTEMAELPAAAGSPKGTLWLDMYQPTPREIVMLSEVFQLDPLVIEDCIHEVHHPKIDDHGDYIYIAAHGVKFGSQRGEIKTVELDIVLAKHWLITHRDDEMRSVNETWDRCLKQEDFFSRGADDVLQGILSQQAGHYVEEVERLQEEVMQMEDQLFSSSSTGAVERLFGIKSDMARLRRILGSQRELLHRISRGETKLIGHRLLLHFRDVYDDLYRATEMLDMLRDIAMAALETYMTLVANRTNEIMKVLTIMSAFILPLTLVTGWYGMNFEHMPELKWKLGEPFVLAIFGAVIVSLWILLRRRRWI